VIRKDWLAEPRTLGRFEQRAPVPWGLTPVWEQKKTLNLAIPNRQVERALNQNPTIPMEGWIAIAESLGCFVDTTRPAVKAKGLNRRTGGKRQRSRAKLKH
jgi:hypothetical protein